MSTYHKVPDIRIATGLLNVSVVKVSIADDIVANSSTVKHRVLLHDGHLLAEALQAVLAYVFRVRDDLAGAGVVKPLDEVEDRALPAATCADERDEAPRFCL